MEYVEIDVPGPQDQIKRRLNSLRNQFDTFIMKYELDWLLKKALMFVHIGVTRLERLIDGLRDGKTGVKRDRIEY